MDTGGSLLTGRPVGTLVAPLADRAGYAPRALFADRADRPLRALEPLVTGLADRTDRALGALVAAVAQVAEHPASALHTLFTVLARRPDNAFGASGARHACLGADAVGSLVGVPHGVFRLSMVAARIRVATGSATVATVTAAGIVAPLAAGLPPAQLALVVLSVGAVLPDGVGRETAGGRSLGP
jgi:GntP family permease